MADISSTSVSETAASNNAAPPDGWPEGMAAAAVNNSARETHGMLKRFWNRTRATVTATGSDPTYVVTYGTAPPALVNGMRFAWVANFANLGTTPTVNVNSLGATTIQKHGAAGLTAMAAGDIQVGHHVEVEYDSSAGVMVIISPLPASTSTFTGGALSSALNEAKGADIASAATCDIGAATGNYVNITGTTTIAAFGTVQAGTRRIVNFRGVLTLTYNATSMILPSAASIVTAVGDTATFISLGSGNWVCTQYQRVSGVSGTTSPITTKTGNYTLASTDNGGTIILNSGSAFTFTLPSDAAVGNGWTVRIINQGAGILTIARAGSDTIASGGSTSLTSIKLSQGDAGDITSDGVTNGIFWWRGSRHYDSGQQTITSAGALTLAHGLGVQPHRVDVWLHNGTGEAGYTVGQEIPVNPIIVNVSGLSAGASYITDATNLTVRFANVTNVWALPNASSGSYANLTNSSWKNIFRAWVHN